MLNIFVNSLSLWPASGRRSRRQPGKNSRPEDHSVRPDCRNGSPGARKCCGRPRRSRFSRGLRSREKRERHRRGARRGVPQRRDRQGEPDRGQAQRRRARLGGETRGRAVGRTAATPHASPRRRQAKLPRSLMRSRSPPEGTKAAWSFAEAEIGEMRRVGFEDIRELPADGRLAIPGAPISPIAG